MFFKCWAHQKERRWFCCNLIIELMLELQLTVTLLILNFFNCFSKYVSSSNMSYLFTIPVDSSQIDHLHSVVISDFWSKCWLSINQLSSKYCFSLDCPLPTFSCLHLAIYRNTSVSNWAIIIRSKPVFIDVVIRESALVISSSGALTSGG